MIPSHSTGVWFLQPRPAVVHFMRVLVDRLMAAESQHEWEQPAWNVVIMPFLIGRGDSEEPPLRYRLLPHAGYANIGVWHERKRAGLPADAVILHLGGVHGTDKVRVGGDLTGSRFRLPI